MVNPGTWIYFSSPVAYITAENFARDVQKTRPHCAWLHIDEIGREYENLSRVFRTIYICIDNTTEKKNSGAQTIEKPRL